MRVRRSITRRARGLPLAIVFAPVLFLPCVAAMLHDLISDPGETVDVAASNLRALAQMRALAPID